MKQHVYTAIIYLIALIAACFAYQAHSQDYQTVIRTAGTLAKVDPDLLLSICIVESNLNPKAFNKHDGDGGSIGLCQIKLGTARMVGFKGTVKELYDPAVNAYWAGLYLRSLLKAFDGKREFAVSAYNMGEAGVKKWGKVVNKSYVYKVGYQYIRVTGGEQ